MQKTVAVLAAVASMVSVAFGEGVAATYTWQGGEAGGWTNGANWSVVGEGAPEYPQDAEATVSIPTTAGTPVEVTSDVGATVKTVGFSGDGDATIDFGGNTLAQSGSYTFGSGVQAFTNGTFTTGKFLSRLPESGKVQILADARVETSYSDDDGLPNGGELLIDGGYLQHTITSRSGNGGLFYREGARTAPRVEIRNNGTFHANGNGQQGFGWISGNGAQVVATGGGSFLLNDINEYTWGSGFGYATDCTVALTNATMTAFVFKFGLDNKKSVGNSLLIHDSKFDMQVPSYATQYTGRRYFTWASGSISNRMVISGTSTASGFSTFEMDGKWNVLRFEGGSGSMPLSMTGTSNRLEMVGGKLTGNSSIAGTYNVASLTNATVSGTMTFGGTSSTVSISNVTMSGKVTIDGKSGLIDCFDGNTSGGVAFSAASSNRVLLVRGTKQNGTITSGGTNNVVVFRGAAVTNRATFAFGTATNFIFALTEGSEYYNDTPISFASKPNARLVISNSTYTVYGRVCVGGGNVDAFDWYNSPNSAIEFCGTNPLMRCIFTPNYKAWVIGTNSGQPLKDPVHFKFVVPPEGYVAAPMQNQISNRSLSLYGNTVFEVDARAYRGKDSLIPLVLNKGGWTDASSTPTGQVLADLNANAILPYGAKLVYNDSKKTLYCKMPRGGLMIFMR